MGSVMEARRRLLMGGELPGIYRRVEYLQSAYGAYINSGVQITADLVLEITLNIPTILNGKYLMGRYSNNNGTFYLYIASGGRFQLAYACGYANTSYYVDVAKHLLRCEISGDTTYAYVDGDLVLSKSGDQKFPDENIFIAGTLMTVVNSNLPCNTYSVKMIKSGKLIRNFIPCVRKADSKPGMYDTVTKTFYTSSGTGEFIVPS